MSVRLDLVQVFAIPNQFPTEQTFHRRSAVANLALMSSFIIVIIQPIVQIFLQAINILIELLAEGDLVKLLQYCFMEAFADTVSLR